MTFGVRSLHDIGTQESVFGSASPMSGKKKNKKKIIKEAKKCLREHCDSVVQGKKRLNTANNKQGQTKITLHRCDQIKKKILVLVTTHSCAITFAYMSKH